MTRTTCPPDHVEYHSEMLATNAITLHGFAHPECKAIEMFTCGDHWHIGHRSRAEREACVALDKPRRDPKTGRRI